MTEDAIPPGLHRNPEFLKLWAAQGVSVLGSAVTQLALPTAAILTLHANPFEVGALAALQRLPFIFFSLHAGAILDRVNRRPVMIACDAGRALVLASVPIAAILGQLGLAHLYVAAFLVGTMTVFFDVAYLAYLPALISRADLMGGNQRLQMTYSVANLIGPGIAGILIQLIGAAQAITANAISYVFSGVMLVLIRAEPAIPPVASPTRMRDEIAEGIRWVFHNPLLRSQLVALTLGGCGFFLALPVVLIFIYRDLHFSPGLAGSVFVIEGLASLVGLWFAPRIVRRLRLGPTMWSSQLVMGFGFILLPLAKLGFPLLVLALGVVVTGFADSVQDVNQVTIRQTLTPPRLQGRMNATFRLFYWGSWPIASLAGGALATWIGLVPTIIAGGLITMAAALLVRFSALGRLRERATSELIAEF